MLSKCVLANPPPLYSPATCNKPPLYILQSIHTITFLRLSRADLAKRLSLWPGVHEVPAGMAMTTDHAPEAQRWNEVPPRQFHIPSVLQGPVKAAVVGPEDVEFEAGVAVGVENAESIDVASEVAALPASAVVVGSGDAIFVATELFPAELPREEAAVELVAGTAVRLDDRAGTEFAAPAGVGWEGDAPLPPTGKQLVPAGFA
jgi:hypothetical protein